jgi:hypothetical protein
VSINPDEVMALAEELARLTMEKGKQFIPLPGGFAVFPNFYPAKGSKINIQPFMSSASDISKEPVRIMWETQPGMAPHLCRLATWSQIGPGVDTSMFPEGIYPQICLSLPYSQSSEYMNALWMRSAEKLMRWEADIRAFLAGEFLSPEGVADQAAHQAAVDSGAYSRPARPWSDVTLT